LIDNDDQSWVDLWAFFERWVASHLRRALKRHGFTELDGDDVMQDIWRRLLEDDRRRLASFKRSTRAELKSWFIRVSVNFTRNWIEGKKAAQRRECEALTVWAVYDRTGPNEQQIEALLCDLEPLADKGDVRRLLILAGVRTHHVSDQTRRKWSRTLRQKYSDHFS